MVKIGKWINNNIKYDIRYHGRNDISATQILDKRTGVCHHFTKLYNAFMYSLGYKVVYVSGYALERNNFSSENAHPWSLFRIDGKWLPFDATWGIFTGKLPVCHIFKQYLNKINVSCKSSDKIEFGKKED